MSVDRDPLLEAHDVVMRSIPEAFKSDGKLIVGPMPGVEDKVFARMALLNSLDLYRSATVLAASGSWGLATALIALAIEEFGKAFVYRFYSLGIFSRDPRDEGKRPYVEERILRCHECKQTVGLLLILGGEVLPAAGYGSEWEERASALSMQDLRDDPALLAEYVPTFAGADRDAIAKELLSNTEAVERLRGPFRLFQRLNALKLAGLYVDRIESVGHTPRELTPDIYEEVRSTACSIMEDSIPLVGGEPPPEVAEVLNKLKDLPFPPLVYKCLHRPIPRGLPIRRTGGTHPRAGRNGAMNDP